MQMHIQDKDTQQDNPYSVTRLLENDVIKVVRLGRIRLAPLKETQELQRQVAYTEDQEGNEGEDRLMLCSVCPWYESIPAK